MHTDCRKAVGGHTTRLRTSTQGNDGVGLGERWQMRIGVLAPPWLTVPPRAYGGTESVVDALARGIAAAGHDVLLWTVGDSRCPVPRGHLYDAARTADMGLASVELPHVLAGYAALERWGADLVHDHSVCGPLVAPRASDMRVVTTNHGRFDPGSNLVYRACGDRVAIVAISHDQAAHAEGVPIGAVIHHGIDVNSYPVGDGLGDEDGPYLLCLARMAPEKGVDRAVRVARRAGMRLLIAAKMHSVAERRYFHQAVEPLLGDGVVYVGEVGPHDKLRLLGGASALLNPIAWPEPFGLAMVEALACGTPVVAPGIGSVCEIIDDGVTGHVCPIGGRWGQNADDDRQLDGPEGPPPTDETLDETLMVQRLMELDRLDRRSCRRAAETRFSTARMVTDHLALYERVLSAAPDRGGRLAGEAA